MIVGRKKSIEINGKEFWSVRQFSQLTGRTEYTIRTMANKGNGIRKLKSMDLNFRKYIFAEELFEFPFTKGGKPTAKGQRVIRFYLDEKSGMLLKGEVSYETPKEA
jgi:hypothetical protein